MVIKCRLCGDENTEIFYKFDFLENSITNKLNKIYLTECMDCNFCFNSVLTQEDCNYYYSTSTNFTHQLYSDNNLKHDRYQHLLQLLEKHNISKNDDIIDLTASDGTLLNYLKYYGYNNLSFCDLSDENINKTNFNYSYNLNLLNKNDFLNINKKYKVIFLLHTLEHIVDLHVVLENIKILMDEDTILYIEVPDMDRISFDALHQHYEVNHEHVNLFTKDTLNNLFILNNYYTIDNGLVNYKYRLNIDVNAFYCIYKYTNQTNTINNINKTYSIRNKILEYIDFINNQSLKLYNFIDINKEIAIFGIGYYAIYFLSQYKNIKISELYDEVRYNEQILNKIIKNINEIDNNNIYLILAPVHFNTIKDKLINKGIFEKNILNYTNIL